MDQHLRPTTQHQRHDDQDVLWIDARETMEVIEHRLQASQPTTSIHWPSRHPSGLVREPWRLSAHLRRRADSRGCPLSWIMQIVTRPIHADLRPRGEGRYAIDPVAVFAEPNNRTVRTVVPCIPHAWRAGRWNDHDARAVFADLGLPDLAAGVRA